MTIIKRGLGKGLSALIPETQEAPARSVFLSGKTILSLEVGKIHPSPFQPRRNAQDNLEDLVASIKSLGVLEPILVRPQGDQFELVAGERRWRASQAAGLTHVPAIVRDISDEKALEIAIVENLQREDLNAMEEAEAFALLGERFNLSHEEIGARVGKNRSTISNAIRLTTLPETIKEAIRNGQLTRSHARSILGETDPVRQIEMTTDIISNNLTVRDVEVLVSENTGLDETVTGVPSKRKKKARRMAPELQIVADQLMEKLGTRVHIHGKPSKGKIVLFFYSDEDLQRLIEKF